MIYVSADDLWELRIDHVFHPNAPRPPVLSLSILPQFNSMGLGRCGCKFKSLIFEHTLRMKFMSTYVIAVMRLAITLANVNQCRHMASQGTIVLNLKLSMIKRDVNNPLEAFNDLMIQCFKSHIITWFQKLLLPIYAWNVAVNTVANIAENTAGLDFDIIITCHMIYRWLSAKLQCP